MAEGVLKIHLATGDVEIPRVSDHGALTGLGDNDHPQYAQENHAARHTDGSDDIQDATSGTKGIASFAAADFNVASGAVGTRRSKSITYIAPKTSHTGDGYLFEHSATRGYVATADGSITGFGVSLDVSTGAPLAGWTIEVRVNGSSVLDRGFSTSSVGDQSAYITQAVGVDSFSAGDIISFYANESGGGSTIANISVNLDIVDD